MTPAIKLAKQLGLDYQIHEFSYDNQADSFGLDAAQKLNLPIAQVFKTLVVVTDIGVLAVAIVPVNKSLNLKKLAKALACKKVKMADPKQVERSTGYMLGGVSPLGQKKTLITVIDSLAQNHTTIGVSAGRRGLEIELPPQQLADALKAQFEDITNSE